ncbi:MAG: putative 2OG-Fe(II) oxygenase, partial [Rhodospirillales bacterium]
EASRKAIALAPDYDKARVNLGDLLLEMGSPGDAVTETTAFLERHPDNTSALAFQAIALYDAGDRDGAARLLDFARLLRPREIAPPEGFTSVAEFNTALARHLRGHPSLAYAPASHATRRGRHSGELTIGDKGPVAGLEQAILAAVADYRQALPPDPDHPFLAQRPDTLSLSIWGVVMEDRGHQVAHIHPAAWLSGVYYPEIPAVVRDDDPDHQGWIEFGRPPADFHAARDPLTTRIRPREGLMLLFPSYLYHETVPFHAPVERLSIAFDVMAGD